MATLDWGKLFVQGRCKAYGIPWSNEESHAVYVLHVPAEYVRKGCLTLKAVEELKAEEKEKVEKTGKVPLSSLRKAQLLSLALAKGLVATEDATKEGLIELLVQAGSPKSIPVEDVPNVTE